MTDQRKPLVVASPPRPHRSRQPSHAQDASTRVAPRHGRARLSSGRQLAYSEVGATSGTAVLFLHGNPGSRREVLRPRYAEAFHQAGLRVVSIDRPGYGDSDAPTQKGHLPFVDDVRCLMDQLDLDRAVVVGHSRGTLPAISLGVLLQRRIAAVGVFGPTGLPDDPHLLAAQSREARWMLKLVKSVPVVARLLIRANDRLDRWFPHSAAMRMARLMSSAADRAQLRATGEEYTGTLAAGMQRDPAFAIDDWRSWLVDPLGFDPTGIPVPLLLWTGTEDGLCPAAPVRDMARRIPKASLREVPGIGHLHSPEILVELMQETLKAGGSIPKTRLKTGHGKNPAISIDR